MDSDKAQTLCQEIIAVDPLVRYAGIANEMGKLIASHTRKDLKLLLDKKELEDNALTAALRMKTRKDYESKLGRPVYTFTLYEKVKRATIPFDAGKFIMMVSFDTNAEHESIILQKILPRLRRV